MKRGESVDKQFLKNFAVYAHDMLIKSYFKYDPESTPSKAEEYAFCWFSRIIAVRYMEANGFSDHISAFDINMIFADNTEWCEEFIRICGELYKKAPDFFRENEMLCSVLPEGMTGGNGLVKIMLDVLPDTYWQRNVQIIGWLYQFFNSGNKHQVYSKLKNNVKISSENIPAATQIFTPDWIVRFMVQNTLGKLWNECGGNLSFEYMADNAVSAVRNSRSPETLTFIDPCMGCGNILVYAFDAFMKIYRSCGYDDTAAALCILEKNIFGLDIDERSYSLAGFSLLMKAAEYSLEIFGKELKMNLAEYRSVAEKCRFSPEKYSSRLLNCDIFGSLLYGEDIVLPETEKLKDILSGTYDVVVTNPPYMSCGNMNSVLLSFIKENYYDYRSDLFSAFLKRCSDFTKNDGYSGFLTPYVWMFIQSCEKLRRYVFSVYTIRTLVQFEYSSFRDATIPLCMFTMKKDGLSGCGCYIRLSDFKGDMDVQRLKTLEAVADKKCGYVYTASPEIFLKLPNAPVAYWISRRTAEIYENAPVLSVFAAPRKGNSTSDNERFLRRWYEVDYNKINIGCRKLKREETLEKYWFPYNKGGGFRKWYGFNSFVVNWYDDAAEIRKIPTSVIANYKYFMKCGLTWSTLTSGKFSIRWFDEGWIFDNGGCCIFELDEKREYICGLLNSKVFSSLFSELNPTLNFQSGDVANFPVVYKPESRIDELVRECVKISSEEYDSFETSRGFLRHPLLP